METLINYKRGSLAENELATGPVLVFVSVDIYNIQMWQRSIRDNQWLAVRGPRWESNSKKKEKKTEIVCFKIVHLTNGHKWREWCGVCLWSMYETWDNAIFFIAITNFRFSFAFGHCYPLVVVVVCVWWHKRLPFGGNGIAGHNTANRFECGQDSAQTHTHTTIEWCGRHCCIAIGQRLCKLDI